MPQRPNPARGFFAELSHRRVLRAVAVYAVAAWAVIEVSDTVLPRLGLPDWTVTLVIVLAALGLPLVLVLAWVFDFTPHGLRRTPDPVPDSAPAAGDVVTARSPFSGRLLAALAVVLLAAGAGAWALLAGRSGPDGDRERSIAVLPFVDMSSARDQEYFADGMTEELLNALAGIETLRVAARTSSFAFKGRNLPVGEVATQLGVRHVLEGSVRKEGDRLRITAQLIDARDGYHLWSDTYDRHLSDVFAIQEEISRAIARALRLELGLAEGESVVREETANPAAHDLYLKGRHEWNQRTPASLRRAAQLMEQALALDPEYARAWVGLAAAYELLPDYDKTAAREQYVGRARAALERALALDPEMGEAHSVLGDIMLHYDWDFAGSERAHLAALARVPNDATAHSWYAEVLEATGRMEEALEHRSIALRLDPLDPKINVDYASVLAWQGRVEDAVAHLDRTLIFAPDYMLAHHQRAIAALALGRLDAAEASMMSYLAEDTAAATQVRRALAGLRDPRLRADAIAAVRALDVDRGDDIAPALFVALGAHDDALDVLERRVAAYDTEAPWIPNHPSFVPLRDHPRFAVLVRRIATRADSAARAERAAPL